MMNRISNVRKFNGFGDVASSYADPHGRRLCYMRV